MSYTCYKNREFTDNQNIIIEKIKSKFKNLSDFNAKLLVSRNITEMDDIEKFLNPSINDFLNPFLMKDSDKFVSIIIDAIKNNKKIVIAHDFDADGVCGGAIGYICLKNLNANVEYFSNNRFEEGYGLSINSVDKIIKTFGKVDVILTIDNGITSFDAVEYCKSLGITVVITDHHSPLNKLPDAAAIVNPKRSDCLYKFKDLCGAGVIFKLMLLLYKNLKKNLNYVLNLMDIAAIATIGDVVPLVGENRIIVYNGLKLINSPKCRKIFTEIKSMTKKEGPISEEYIAFFIVPLINACSRIQGTCYDSLKLFLEDNEYFLIKNITKLIDLNNERKELTSYEYDIAKNIVLKNKQIRESSFLVVYDERFHEGIIGLIAARLTEDFNKPSIVFAKHKNTGILKGSARSTKNINMKKTLEKASHLLIGFGGHSGAAGMSIESKNVDMLRNCLNKIVSPSLVFKPEVLYIDSVLEDISYDKVTDINALAPFGEGFEKPRIGLKNFNCYGMNLIKESHLKILSDKVSIMIFNIDKKVYEKLTNAATIKAIGSPEIVTYKNMESINFIVEQQAVSKSSECRSPETKLAFV